MVELLKTNKNIIGKLYRKEIYAIKEKNGGYLMRVISKYTHRNGCSLKENKKIIDDIQENEFKTIQDLFEELYSYLNKNGNIVYKPTEKLKNLCEICNINTCMFDLSLDTKVNDNENGLELFFRLNNYEDIIANGYDEIDEVREFEKYILDIIKKQLNINININFDNINLWYSDKDLHYRNLYEVTYKMMVDKSKGNDIYSNDLYNNIIPGLENINIEYFPLPRYIKNVIKHTKCVIIKYMNGVNIKTWNNVINIDKYNNRELYVEEIMCEVHDIIKNYSTGFNDKLTTLYDREKKVMIICLYDIKEEEIQQVKINIEEVKNLMN